MPDRKVMIITGASSGIGRALAIQAAEAGYAVVSVSRDQPELEHVCAELASEGNACAPLVTDVTAPDAPARIVNAARSRFGRIDVIVHCAGAAVGGMLLDQTDEQIDGQWQLHVAAPLRITREAFPLLKASHGQVMFIGSGLRRVPVPYYGAYPAAKAAIEALATQLRRELTGTGVAVTFVDPGSVRTNFAKNAGIAPYGPSWVPVKPELVAKRILRAVEHRPWRLLAVPWHTVGAILGEWFPYFTDKSVAPPPAAPQRHGEQTRHGEQEHRASHDANVIEPRGDGEQLHHGEIHHGEIRHGEQDHRASHDANVIEPQSFEAALEPVARRLERVKLPSAFLADLLRPGSDVHLSEAAMRWAGMPNKNERAAMQEALDALAAGGFLEPTGEESWRVVRSAQ